MATKDSTYIEAVGRRKTSTARARITPASKQAVQVNGKIRDRIVVTAEADEEQIKQKALSSEKVIAAMAGKEPKKIIVIKSRLVNIVL